MHIYKYVTFVRLIRQYLRVNTVPQCATYTAVLTGKFRSSNAGLSIAKTIGKYT